MRVRYPSLLVPVIAALAACAATDKGCAQQPVLQPPAEHRPAPTGMARPNVRPLDWVLQPFTYSSSGKAPVEWQPFTAPTYDRALPIDLTAALRLVNSQALDIAIASEQIRKASAQYDQAKYIWLPTITAGPEYYRHDGQYQNSAGQVNTVSLTSFSTGAGVNAIFTPADAIYQALAARQVVRSRQADLTATTNDTVTLAAQAYFTAQQARGNVFATQETVRESLKLVDRTRALSKQGLVLPVEEIRARAELARRKQSLDSAMEQWRNASADLTRILRLDPTARIEPREPPHLQVTLVELGQPVDALIPIGLRNRPELASQQALVEAALLRLQAEKIRPLIPSVVLSGQGPGGSTVGVFGGGNTAMSNYAGRSDFSVQAVWTFENLGLTNIAKVRQRQSDQRIAILQMFKVQDQVAAEIAQAYASAWSAQGRLRTAEEGLKDALESLDKNFEGMKQTRVAGNLVIMLIRPQEVNAAVIALANAYGDYYGAVADFNRAQFLLFRALGFPSHIVTGNEPR
jgi:outer membrane protein TolC